MAIKHRRGNYSDFDPGQMVAGEVAVVLSGDPSSPDGRTYYACFQPGHVKRLMTLEDLQKEIDAVVDDIVQSVTVVAEKAEDAADRLDAAQDVLDALSQRTSTAQTVKTDLDAAIAIGKDTLENLEPIQQQLDDLETNKLDTSRLGLPGGAATLGEDGKWNEDECPDNIIAAGLIADRIYDGVDLTVKHAAEISTHSNVWEWIKLRIQNANFVGLHIGDYIPFKAAGITIKAEIAGIDIYYRYGNDGIQHHIDFVSQSCWPEKHPFNKANYNNGTSVNGSPWLASDLYAWLNSLSMQVPNAATANPAMIPVDYSTTGVYDKLPAELKAVITQKNALLPIRYAAGSLLTDDQNWAWNDIGNLWIPSELEVFGASFWNTNGYACGGFRQYPIFTQQSKRIKGNGSDIDRMAWWLLSAKSNDSAQVVRAFFGNSSPGNATYTGASAPICFRIAADI